MASQKKKSRSKLESLTHDIVSYTNPFKLGKAYLIRTVTHYLTGEVVLVTPSEIVLKDAAWIADTGRFATALKNGGDFNEVEPFPDGEVIVGRGALIDACRIDKLPRVQK